MGSYYSSPFGSILIIGAEPDNCDFLEKPLSSGHGV